MRQLSQADAKAIAVRMISSDVHQVERLNSFAGNQVFRIGLSDQVCYLKLAVDPRLHRDITCEFAVLQTLLRSGVPVPRVEAYDPMGDLVGVPCVLLRDVGGQPLTGAEPEFQLVGAHLRTVHEIPLAGFGWIASGQELRGEDNTWSDTVRRRIAAIDPAVKAGLVSADLVTRLSTAVEDRRDLIEVPYGRLLHGDFHPRHVYAAEGEITGIIDWGDAMSGDPVYDFGRVLHSGMRSKGLEFGLSLVEVLAQGYGDAPWMQGELVTKMLLYAGIFIVSSMEGEFSSGAPWPPFWPAQSAVLSDLLDALDDPRERIVPSSRCPQAALPCTRARCAGMTAALASRRPLYAG